MESSAGSTIALAATDLRLVDPPDFHAVELAIFDIAADSQARNRRGDFGRK